jgi:plastocyanin
VPLLAINSDGGPGVGARMVLLAVAVLSPILIAPPSARANPLGDSAANQSASVEPQPHLTPPQVSGPAVIVKMQDDAPMYSPDTVEITAGQTVEWRNFSDVSHSVVDDPSKADHPGDVALPQGVKPFSSGNVMPGGKYRHTFTKPGDYRYFCWSHEADDMVGEVIVKPLPPSAAAAVAAQNNSRPWSERERQPDP